MGIARTALDGPVELRKTYTTDSALMAVQDSVQMALDDMVVRLKETVDYNIVSVYGLTTPTDTDTDGSVPVGSIIAHTDHLSGTPSLPSYWALCDGSVISDSDSPMNGETLPNYTTGNNRYMRGDGTSGTIVAAVTLLHDHDLGQHTHPITDLNHNHTLTINGHSHTLVDHDHTGPSHSHDLEKHIHVGSAHTHGPGSFEIEIDNDHDHTHTTALYHRHQTDLYQAAITGVHRAPGTGGTVTFYTPTSASPSTLAQPYSNYQFTVPPTTSSPDYDAVTGGIQSDASHDSTGISASSATDDIAVTGTSDGATGTGGSAGYTAAGIETTNGSSGGIVGDFNTTEAEGTGVTGGAELIGVATAFDTTESADADVECVQAMSGITTTEEADITGTTNEWVTTETEGTVPGGSPHSITVKYYMRIK